MALLEAGWRPVAAAAATAAQRDSIYIFVRHWGSLYELMAIGTWTTFSRLSAYTDSGTIKSRSFSSRNLTNTHVCALLSSGDCRRRYCRLAPTVSVRAHINEQTFTIKTNHKSINKQSHLHVHMFVCSCVCVQMLTLNKTELKQQKQPKSIVWALLASC